ncbi:MAG TPA: glutathione peroxidase [Terracidiphilus sp.]|nr:glutathione peroxidase [Terracidiphilus sp.]
MTGSIYEIPVLKITGQSALLSEFKGKVILIVNVASKCGLTPQYEGLESLYEKYHDQGFVVAGFPANDFRNQEPGNDSEILTFCTESYGVCFPMYSKINVVGPDKHPLYAALIHAQPKAIPFTEESFRKQLKSFGIDTLPEPELLWNFEKFLVSREGQVVKRFSPETPAEAPALIAAVEAELAR